MAELERAALVTGKGGSFISAKSNAKVTIEASAPILSNPRDYGMAGTAKPQPLVLVDPIRIKAYVDTPVYDTLDETLTPSMIIKEGVPMQVSAKVANTNWSVVGDDKVGLGYVPTRFLQEGVLQETKTAMTASSGDHAVSKARRPNTTSPAKSVPPKPVPALGDAKPAKADVPESVSKEQYEAKLTALNAAYRPRSSGNYGSGTGAAKPPSDGAVTIAQASSECKVVSRKVDPPGGASFSEQVRYCNEPPSGWQARTVT